MKIYIKLIRKVSLADRNRYKSTLDALECCLKNNPNVEVNIMGYTFNSMFSSYILELESKNIYINLMLEELKDKRFIIKRLNYNIDE